MSEGSNEWKIEHDNDTGPRDDAYVEWWDVTNGEKTFRTFIEEDAKQLCDLLNQKYLPDAERKAEAFDWIETNKADVQFQNESGFVWNISTESGEIDEGGETLMEAYSNARQTEKELAADP